MTSGLRLSRNDFQQWFVEQWNQTYANIVRMAQQLGEPICLTDALMQAAQAVNKEMKVRFPMMRHHGYDFYVGIRPRNDTCYLHLELAPRHKIVTAVQPNRTLH